MNIGRKIYYDKATGNVYYVTSEMLGDVMETTKEQDFITYISLHGIDPETVGIVKLEYGEDQDKFSLYYFHVNPTTSLIVWGDPIDQIAPPVMDITEQIKELQSQNAQMMLALVLNDLI